MSSIVITVIGFVLAGLAAILVLVNAPDIPDQGGAISEIQQAQQNAVDEVDGLISRF